MKIIVFQRGCGTLSYLLFKHFTEGKKLHFNKKCVTYDYLIFNFVSRWTWDSTLAS